MYYNYHAIAKKLILNNFAISASIFKSYHHISPALVIYFANHKPIPIRQYMWEEYLSLLKTQNVNVLNEDNLPLN